jgi:hypothetical protein
VNSRESLRTMICVDPGPRKPLAILHRRSNELPGTFVCTDANLKTVPGLWRTV